MSKRKLAVDSYRGDIALGQRTSVAHLQFRATNVICDKHVAMNVRPTSNCKVVQNHNNAKRSCTDSTETPQCNAVHKGRRINLLKSRVNSANAFEVHMPRLKDSPARSVEKSDTLWPNFSSPVSTQDSQLCPDQITSMTVPPSHGHGDSMKIHSVDELMQQPQQQHVQQSSNEAVTVSQQHVPIEQHVNRANQSELSINKQLSSLGTQLHRPFVPHAMHGSTLRELSMSKTEAASPPVSVRKSSTLSIQCQGERQRLEYPRSADQAHRFPSFIPQQKLQFSQQLMTHRVKDDVRTTLRACNPLEGDGVPTKPAHEECPGSKDYNTVCQPPVASRENSNNQQTIVNVGQTMTLRDIPCSDISVQQEEAMQLQRSYHTQQQRQQWMNRQGQSAVNSMQNVQKMHQLMRNNMIRQRQMQQRVLSQQQQMLIRAQQQIAPQPMVCNMRKSTQETPVGSKSLRNCCMYEEKITKPPSESHQESNILPSQHCQPSQTAMPHYEMLMQQRSIGDQTRKVCPQNAGVNNHQLTVANSNVNGLSKRYLANEMKVDEEIVSPNDVFQCGNFKLDHAQCQLKAKQRIVDQQIKTHGHETVPCPWYGRAMDTYSPSLYGHQTRNPISMQQYSTTQQEQDVPLRNSEATAVHGHPQSKCQQLQPQQEYKPMSKDQHVQITEYFNQPRSRFELRNIKKKYADFTSAMIRDQELLVLNMRQQKIPEDTMRRQFDALLGEQRRLLALFDQVESAETQNDAPLCRNPRISLEDERPGWMGRITPPRITIQQVQRSRRSPSRRAAGGHREEQRHDSERAKQYVETQQHTIQQLSDNTRCSTIVAHEQLNPSHMDNCQLHRRHSDHWECNAGRTPQAVLSRSQQENDRPSDLLQTAHNNQPCHISAALHKSIQQQILQQRQSSHEQHGQHRENDESARNNLNISGQQRDPNVESDKASSLLKLQKYKKCIWPQRQNNGLQKIVQGMLKASESSEHKKGLGYVVDLGNKMKATRFNGIQDPSELEKLSPPPFEYLEKIQQSERPKISANGLSNTRNADNPASPPKRFTDKTDHRLYRALLGEYPRQCHPGKKLASKFNPGSQNMMAEKENYRTIGTVRQWNDSETLFQNCGQASSEEQHLSQWRNVVDDPVESMAIPSDSSNLRESHGNVSITPYEVNGSQSQSHGHMDQFYRNQQNLKFSTGNDTTKALTKQPAVLNGSCSTAQRPWISLDPVIQPELQDGQSKTMADFDRNQQASDLIVRTVVTSDHSAMLTHDAQNFASIVANVACENGQPEIRRPRMIGGFTYLARKVDYIENPSLIAPNCLITSKFLQPLISFH